ncbi:MAG: hypothetical protein GY751_06240, partial [Bacteroidetes bacterium]|nr:hypothetical protein [Bacteroidota bacterium]
SSQTVVDALFLEDKQVDNVYIAADLSATTISALTDVTSLSSKNVSVVLMEDGAAEGYRLTGVEGRSITSLGAVSTDIDMEFNENFSNADYSGSVSLQDFKIGRLLDVDSLGNITITCSVDGSGMTPDSLKASSIIHVEKVDYNGYNYQDISLNGDFERRMFTGDLTIRDEHLYMDLSGAFNMNDSIPAMKFNADIDRLDLHALNFASDTFSIHAGISADFSGIDPDDADGRILVTDLAMKKNKRHWSADTVAIVALKDFTGRRDISINSPVARGTLTGEFSFSHLTAMLTDFADDYFHVGELLTDSDSSATTEEEIFTEEYAELSLDVEDLVPLAELFNINLTRMDAAHLYFLLDDRRKILDLEFDIPYVQYGTMAVDSFRLRADNTNGSLNTFVNTGKVDLAEGVSIPEAEIKLTAAGQKADVQLTLAGDSARQRLDLNTHWHSTPGQIQLEIGDSMVLNGKDWSVDMKDPFTFYRNSVDFPSIAIQSGEEVLRMEERKGMLGIDLLNFDVANLTGLVDYGGGTIGGALIGNVDLGLKKDQPIFIGDLDLRSLYLNTDTIGNLSLSAGSDGQTAWAALDFTGGGSEATAEANYDLKSRLIDGEVVLERINLSTFEKILVNYVSETSGYIDGNIHLKGAVSAPEIDGRLNFTNASAFVVP